jgi:MYND finger
MSSSRLPPLLPVPPTSPPRLYDGTNLELREPHCAECGRTESEAEVWGAPLLRCARCGVVKYCDVECQRSDFNAHKSRCRDVQLAREKLEELAEPLRSFPLPDGTATTSLFETRVGDFVVRSCVFQKSAKGADAGVIRRNQSSVGAFCRNPVCFLTHTPVCFLTNPHPQPCRRIWKRRGST